MGEGGVGSTGGGGVWKGLGGKLGSMVWTAREVVGDGEKDEEGTAGAVGNVEVMSGDALCVLLGLPWGTRALEMEVPCTRKAPSFALKLGSACAGFVVKALVRVTAARVACDGVAETVLPGGNRTDTLRVSALGDATGAMVVIVLRGAVACWRALEVSCATVA